MKYSDIGFYIKKEADDLYRIGLSDKGQDDVGEIMFVDLLEKETLEIGEAFIALEGAKAVTDLNAPFSGKIEEINQELYLEPERLNETDAETNWILLVSHVSESELATLNETSGFEG